MSRILAIDYGTKRCGIAVSDPTETFGSALATVATCEVDEFLKEYIPQNDVTMIVLGLPTRTDGTPSETHSKVIGFSRKLQKLFPDVALDFYDERFTSALAKMSIIDSGTKKMARRDKSIYDRVSAAIILNDYLESQRLKKERL